MDAATSVSPTAAAASEAMAAAIAAYFRHKFFILQLCLLGGYGVMFVLCGVLIGYMRYHRNAALRGNAVAARKIILPAFEPLLWILGGATGVYTFFFAIALSVDMFTTEISKLATEFFYSGRQFVFVSVVVFLFQKSVSIPALRRSVLVSLLLSTYTIPVVWYLSTYSKSTNFYLVMMPVRGLLLGLYLLLFLRPPLRASKRTLREFCAFTFVYYSLLFTYMDMFRRKKSDLGFALTYANLAWGALCPLVIWRVLKADTEHWRGLGQRAVALQGLFRQRRSAVDERVSSQGLHLMIEMHRKYIIDFAYLDVKEQIGQGSSAAVFRGVLHSRTNVAVKVYTPNEFSEETVAAFSHEAALCGALHHPNIVKFYGMCVCPPTIGLVSELCEASLDDVLNSVHRRSTPALSRERFLLSIAYMLDAARALAYLHSFSPPFAHRDIKPSNFLVDFQGNVKLTDFGESRILPRPGGSIRELHPYMVVASGAHVNRHGRYSGNVVHNRSLSQSSLLMTIRGTVDYMAPEVINGRAGVASYGEAADVYSLAITMWDILYPGREKYPTLRNNHLQIFESVLDGRRPELGDNIHPSLGEIIQSAWQSDVRVRPSAQNIVHILESIQEEVQAYFANQLLQDLNAHDSPTPMKRPTKPHRSSNNTWAESTFIGSDAVAHMVDSGYARSASEAIRLGNALMDAGHVHHVRHSRGFENSNEMYFFDEDNINLCHPLLSSAGIAGSRSRGDEDGSHDAIRTRGGRSSTANTTSTSSDFGASGRDRRHSERRPLMERHGLCACRKLGKRLEKKGSGSDKRFKKKPSSKVAVRIGAILEEVTGTGLTRHLLVDEERHTEAFDSSDHVVLEVRGPAGA